MCSVPEKKERCAVKHWMLKLTGTLVIRQDLDNKWDSTGSLSYTTSLRHVTCLQTSIINSQTVALFSLRWRMVTSQLYTTASPSLDALKIVI